MTNLEQAEGGMSDIKQLDEILTALAFSQKKTDDQGLFLFSKY